MLSTVGGGFSLVQCWGVVSKNRACLGFEESIFSSAIKSSIWILYYWVSHCPKPLELMQSCDLLWNGIFLFSSFPCFKHKIKTQQVLTDPKPFCFQNILCETKQEVFTFCPRMSKDKRWNLSDVDLPPRTQVDGRLHFIWLQVEANLLIKWQSCFTGDKNKAGTSEKRGMGPKQKGRPGKGWSQ